MIQASGIYKIKKRHDNVDTVLFTRIHFNYLKALKKTSRLGWTVQVKLAENEDMFSHTPWTKLSGTLDEEVIKEYFELYEKPTKVIENYEEGPSRLGRVIED